MRSWPYPGRRPCRSRARSARGAVRSSPAWCPPAAARGARARSARGGRCWRSGSASAAWRPRRARGPPACWRELRSSKRAEASRPRRWSRTRARSRRRAATVQTGRRTACADVRSSCVSPSVAGLSRGDPWLCEPVSRRVCRFREQATTRSMRAVRPSPSLECCTGSFGRAGGVCERRGVAWTHVFSAISPPESLQSPRWKACNLPVGSDYVTSSSRLSASIE